FLAGHLLGSLDSNGTQFYLSDAQGSLVSSFTNAAGGATMKSNQVFGPYGNTRYNAGSLNTAKGFIGQYNDGTGLDYFNARYYDPIVGVFLSADTVQGNAQGMNPYGYGNGNPETHSDPTGLRPIATCPTTSCNAPVDMSALSAAIFAWATSASGQYKTNAVTSYVPPTPKPSLPPSTNTSGSNIQDMPTSCGVPITQGTCGNFFVNYAFYTPFGDVAVPGVLCLTCGSSGGSDRGGDSSGNSNLSASSETEGAFNGAETGPDPASSPKDEVLLDTNAVYTFKQLVDGGIIDLSKENPVISETVLGELEANADKGKPNWPSIGNDFYVVKNKGSVGTIEALYNYLANQPIKQQGLLNDLEIAATAFDTNRTLITGDQRIYEALLAIGGDGRLFKP
ncbi:MAG: RHS repeat-associated core domain-containing protein, partial [Ktedonobacteraceae bacterium]